MKTPLRVLIVEDSENDKELLLVELRRGGYDPEYTWVQTEEDMNAALDQHEWDIIISDYSMPRFNGLVALQIAKSKRIDIPFILISGTIGEEVAVKAMKEGANDYLMKGNIKRLIPAIERELKDAEVRRQRTWAEEALQKNEAMLTLVLNSIPQSIFWKDRNSTYLGCNKVFAKAAGFDNPDSVIGKTDFDLPWSREESDAYRKDDKAVIESQQPKIHFIETQTQADGRTVWVDTTKIPLKDIHNLGYGILGIYDDITEQKIAEEALKESELRFRVLAESAPVGIFTTDTSGATNYVNSRWCKISALSSEEALGHGWLKAIHPDDRNKLATGWQQSVQERTSSKAEYRFIHPDGSEAWVIGQVVPQKDEKGNVMGFIGTITDITERKTMEADLIASKEKAEENNRLKSALLSNMSHEIRTPMNAIMGFSNLMSEADVDEKNAYAAIIEKSSEQLLTLIDDVILLSRLQSEKMPVNNIVFSPYELVTDISLMFNHPDLKKGLDIKASISEQYKNLVILSDAGKIRQVLTNLTSNAVKYTLEGSIEIGFNLRGELIEFYVKDTGIGIPEQEKHRIFETFYRGEQAISSAIRGTGLGLNIAKELVSLMGGSIGVNSVHRKGSYFYFTIPLEQSESKRSGTSLRQPAVNKMKNLKILIADDEPINFQYIEILLKGKAKLIDHAINGKIAIEMASKTRYDFILMDLKMPVMGGIEATEILKRQFPEIPIIAQTAYTMPDDKEISLRAGCDDVISKPIKKEELIALLQKYSLRIHVN